MAYSNSVLNPIIYAGFNENFKQEISYVLQPQYLEPEVGVLGQQNHSSRFEYSDKTTSKQGHESIGCDLYSLE
uniref:Uncharacterized protein n=1 Tax=Magallana gigas TaxID=29159 RepID=K1PBJ9_MAGGI